MSIQQREKNGRFVKLSPVDGIPERTIGSMPGANQALNGGQFSEPMAFIPKTDPVVAEHNRRLTLADLARIADEANARLEAARKRLEAAEQELSDAELAQQNATFALKNRL